MKIGHTKKVASLGFGDIDLRKTTTQAGNRWSAWTVICKVAKTNVHICQSGEDKHTDQRVV
jgi:hypothetical protein